MTKILQLYAKIDHLIQTEEEYMANRSKEVNEWTRQAMIKYRQQIAVNGIYDQLKINQNRVFNDGNDHSQIVEEDEGEVEQQLNTRQYQVQTKQ